MHTLTITNQTLGTSGVGPVEWLFNRGPYELSGGSSVVNANGWEPQDGYGVDWVPSMRQVIDLSNFDNSTWVNLTGASGHTFHPNYRDQTDAWVAGDQFPWRFTPGAVDAAARNRLTLNPS
jgi:penicillin amidase